MRSAGCGRRGPGQWAWSPAVVVLAASIAACGGRSSENDDPYAKAGNGSLGGGPGHVAGAAGVGSAGESGGGSSAGTGSEGGAGEGGASAEPEDCTAREPFGPGLVRLTLSQLKNSIEQLVDAEVARSIERTFELDAPRAFPPLASPREGSVYTNELVATSDRIAAHVGEYIGSRFRELTGCTDRAPAVAAVCARKFVIELGSRAYRRPLTAEEATRIEQLSSEAEALGATAAELAQYGAYAVLSAPAFLYRSEFALGERARLDGLLPAYEMASQLAFFLTDRPPDATLLAAAAAGELESVDQIALHTERLLESPIARSNLEAALVTWTGLDLLDAVIIDPAVAPEFRPSLLDAMLAESRYFFAEHAWDRPLGEFVTSRNSRINQELAALYGVAFPPSGVTPDAAGFSAVELPVVRSGLLTQAAFLTVRSRPDDPSVVGRGLVVSTLLACQESPPFPEDLMVPESPLPNAPTARERAEYRMATEPCAACHVEIDPYGLVLDSFDVIGRYRSVDRAGRAIDTRVTLPSALRNAKVESAADLGRVLSDSGRLSLCLARAFLTYGLSDAREADAASKIRCAAQQVADAHAANENPSFGGLIRHVVNSELLLRRKP